MYTPPKKNEVAERKNSHYWIQPKLFYFKTICLNPIGEIVLTATHLINWLPSRVLGFKRHMDMLSKFYPNLSTTNHLTPRIYNCISFVFMITMEENWIQEQLSVSLWKILQCKRNISAIILDIRKFMSQLMLLLMMTNLTSTLFFS